MTNVFSHPLDAAIILDQMVVINGMLQHGTPEQKQRAKDMLKQVEPLILANLEQKYIQQAQYDLNISDDEMKIALGNLRVTL